MMTKLDKPILRDIQRRTTHVISAPGTSKGAENSSSGSSISSVDVLLLSG